MFLKPKLSLAHQQPCVSNWSTSVWSKLKKRFRASLPPIRTLNGMSAEGTPSWNAFVVVSVDKTEASFSEFGIILWFLRFFTNVLF